MRWNRTLTTAAGATTFALVLFWVVAIPWFGELPDLPELLSFSAWTVGLCLIWLFILCYPVFKVLSGAGLRLDKRWVRGLTAFFLALLPLLVVFWLGPRRGAGEGQGVSRALMAEAIPWLHAFTLGGSLFLGRLAKALRSGSD